MEDGLPLTCKPPPWRTERYDTPSRRQTTSAPMPPTHLLGGLIQDGEDVARHVCHPHRHHREPVGEVHIVQLQALAVGCDVERGEFGLGLGGH